MNEHEEKPVKYQSVSWACDLCMKAEVIELSPKVVNLNQITTAVLTHHREVSPACKGNYADMKGQVKFRDTMGHFKIINAQPLSIATLQRQVEQYDTEQARKPKTFFPRHVPRRAK